MTNEKENEFWRRAKLTVGPVNKENAKRVKKMQREAGLMGGLQPPFTTKQPTSGLDAYYTSYTDGSNLVSGIGDIPRYLQIMNSQNGGVIAWPTTLREKYSWFRYWRNNDAYVGRAIDMMTDLPLSKLILNMPKLEGISKELKKEIHAFFQAQCEHLNLFQSLHYILCDYFVLGNVFAFHEFDEKKGWWDKIVVLPPEEVRVFHHPFGDGAHVEYRPEKLVSLIQKCVDNSVNRWDSTGEVDYGSLIQAIPQEIIENIKTSGAIQFDTDPTTGSFVYHFAHRRFPYHDLGVSMLERVLIPMLMKEHYKYTQLSLASRNMTPKNKISAPGIDQVRLDDLRAQVDMSYMDPDYTIVTNYDWMWEQIGADGRLLPLGEEYDRIENQLFAGLGVTRELMTGEGTFGGNRITIEIMNSMFLNVREMLQNYIEKNLFHTICEKKGWFDLSSHGIKRYWSPKVTFNRINIRDNAEVFESLFQLYQKGSLPIDAIYELFNLDSDTIHDKIYDDMFTVKDNTYNRMLEEVNSAMGQKIAAETNIMDKYVDYLGLTKTGSGEEGADAGGDTGGGFDMGGEEPSQEPAEEPTQEPAGESSEEPSQEPSGDQEAFTPTQSPADEFKQVETPADTFKDVSKPADEFKPIETKKDEWNNAEPPKE